MGAADSMLSLYNKIPDGINNGVSSEISEDLYGSQNA